VVTSLLLTLIGELFLVMFGVGGVAKNKKSWNYHLSPIFLYLTLSGLTTIALFKDPLFFFGGEWWQMLLNFLTAFETAIFLVFYPCWCFLIFYGKQQGELYNN
jgi:hypothetical protein